MTKRLQNLFPAGIFKIGLVTAIALISGFSGFGQNLNSGMPAEQVSPTDVDWSFMAGFTTGKKGLPGRGKNGRISAGQALPLTSQGFNPNSANTGWILYENGRYTSDAQGNQTSYTRAPVSGLYPAVKDSSLYDMHGNQIYSAQFTRFPGSTSWDMDYAYRKQYTYNTAGQPTEILTEQSNLAAWVNSGREVLVYNAAGYVTEHTTYRWLNNSWEPKQKFVYGFTVATNPHTSMTIQTYNGSTWVNQTRYQNLTWHTNGSYLTREEQTWYMNAWVSQSRSTVVFDALGGSVEVTQTFNGQIWQNSSRGTITVNMHSHVTGLKLEVWQNNTWAFSNEREFLLTYNAASQLTELIVREWDFMTNSMQNTTRITYANFQVMGTAKELPKLDVKIYPNPTTDLLRIETPATGNLKATLSDLTGKVILTQNLPTGNNQQLNLSSLVKGTYLLKLETKNEVSIQKVVKQ